MNKFVYGLLFCSVAATTSASASGLVDATNPQVIRDIIAGFGSAELGKDSKGDPKITGRMDGNSYTVFFYGCQNGNNCDDIQFNAGWSKKGLSLEDLNNWNLKKRYGKVFIDSVGDPILQMTVNIDYGVSRKNLEDSISWWKRSFSDFDKMLSDK